MLLYIIITKTDNLRKRKKRKGKEIAQRLEIIGE